MCTLETTSVRGPKRNLTEMTRWLTQYAMYKCTNPRCARRAAFMATRNASFYSTSKGTPFCGTCAAGVTQQRASHEKGSRREQWTRSLAEQLASWRGRATEALGVSASAGVAIGGAAATATGAAFSLVRAVVQGAMDGAPSLKLSGLASPRAAGGAGLSWTAYQPRASPAEASRQARPVLRPRRWCRQRSLPGVPCGRPRPRSPSPFR